MTHSISHFSIHTSAARPTERFGIGRLVAPMFVAAFALLVAVASAHASFQLDTNPLNGPRALAPSGELVVLSPALGGLQQEALDFTFDPSDPSNPPATGFFSTGTALEADVGTLDEWTPLGAAVGDFDGSGEAEYAYAWVGADGNVRVRVVGSAGGAPSVLGPVLDHGHSPGSRPIIKLVTGQFDADPAQELAIVHTRDVKQIHWAKYDVGADLSLTEASSGTQSNGGNGAGCNSTAQNLVDAVAADVDGDGIDNLVLGRMQEGCNQTQITNNMYVETVEFGPGSFFWFHTCTTPATCPVRPSDVKIAAGYFSGRQNPIEIAFHFPTGAWVGQANMPSWVGRVVWNGTRFVEIASEQALVDCAGTGCVDRRFAIAAADLNNDGTDELVAARGPRLEIYEAGAGTFGIASGGRRAPHATASLTGGGHFGLAAGRLAVSDFDQLHTTTLGSEIAVLETDGAGQAIRFFEASKSSGSWQLTAPAAPNDRRVLAGVAGRDPVILAHGDLDRDQLYLGAPGTPEVVADVAQPVVVLNSPPIHFDVADDGSEIFDVSECFPIGASCTHLASYTQSGSTSTIATTTVGASWAVAAEATVAGGYQGGIFGASLEATLMSEYGQDFSNSNLSDQSFSVSTTTQGSRDGRAYMTIADYRIIEYPVYVLSDLATPISHVVTVDPGTISHTWYDLSGTQGFQIPSAHSPNNVLSYGPRSRNEDIRFTIPFTLTGDDISNGLSDDPANSLDVTIAFDSLTSSEQAQGSSLSLGSSLTAEAHVDFAGFHGSVSASVSGSYASDTLRTHETVITQSTELQVTLGHIDGSLLVNGQGVGNATYVVTPYAYWSQQGALVLDYEVAAGYQPADTDGHWWDAVYGVAPDLSFNLPMQHDHEKGLLSTSFAALERTRDIAVDPPAAMSGTIATLQAVVRNHSLVDYNPGPGMGVDVSFYLEDPRSGGSLIGSEIVDFIAARDFALVEVAWAVPFGVQPVGANGSSRIYVEIDQSNAVFELHEENNVAWASVQVVSLPECSDGFDNDGDGFVDFGGDAGCSGAGDLSELDLAIECDDGIDNDGDGYVDFNLDPQLSDPGCFDSAWTIEAPQCDDGIDNDGNGDVDASDPQCAGRLWRDSEQGSGSFCGLGFEGGLILPLVARLRRRRARKA